MKRHWIRKIIGALSFTSAMFVFQACYGTPQDFGADTFIEGEVKSLNSGLPINGIKVSVANNFNYAITDVDGKFSMYVEKSDSLVVDFQDVDSTQNGLYKNTSQIINEIDENVFMNVVLQEN